MTFNLISTFVRLKEGVVAKVHKEKQIFNQTALHVMIFLDVECLDV